ncbi:hypothetical protein BHF71_09180 [Vulcanibacillus modesticaldus]|uniref:HTH arsR-type domain-containing protein n=1 Tax=Vulcanibacillus modesticaldus TaxID=337097 RepID=A0A1D2YUF7_9BACI|nr:helix-turn-helix domain-containing protein [Vulcanibacillus modesticaldus]OEF99285.1 hypothetical protein BHF71_09180 [Vulcanibacillus modesticaldus]
MENETLKLTSVLADPTRYSIYKHIASINKPVNVQEIAEKFKIHPNVARLHLSKLEDVNLLLSKTEKTGRGGRPSRVYSLSNEEICLQFPARNYQLLADIAIKSLLAFGKEGLQVFKEMGKKFGKDAAKQAIIKDGIGTDKDSPLDKRVESIENLIISQGLRPEIEIIDENIISFGVNNCIFHGNFDNKKDPQICLMHQCLFEGIFETYLGEIDFIKEYTNPNSAICCKYTTVVLSTSRHS